MKNADKPANPIEINGFGQYAPEAHTGLTKREMFAMHAMQGLLSSNASLNSSASYTRKFQEIDQIASYATLCADSLLAELEK